MKSGFTLLELLIVISIIGLLSSIVLVTYPTAVEKAHIAKTLQWSASVNHLLGVDAVGVWTFDNIQGTTVYDDSGYNNNGTIVGAAVVDGVMGKALNFGGSNAYVVTPAKLGAVSTITAWAKTTTANRMLWCIDHDYHGPDLYFACGKIVLNIWDGCANPFCDIPANAIDGQWHHYAVIIAPGNTKLYFDSKLCGIANYKDPTGTNFYISSGAGYDWNGQVDDVRIFSTAYTQAQVKQLYADGLAAHHNLAIIK